MDAYLFPRSKEAGEVGAYEEQEEDIGCASESESSARNTIESSSSWSSELADDASSSSSSSLDRFEMSSLMTQLPLKRGLSKFFDGKSQSFASLAAVRGLEDLEKPPQKRLKLSRSCGVGLDARRRSFLRRGPNAPGSGGKKAPRGPLSMLGAAPRQRTRLPMVAPVPARTEGVTGQALLFA